ncbi:MAG TPA: hypothetical protein VGG16_19535 [Streptosporangiaceae bacterium]
MRFRLTATYLGATYRAALGPGDDEVTLFAACPPPEELGFSSAAGHWRLLVGIDDIGGLRQSRPVGVYRGGTCLVLDDQGDRLHITYLGDDPEQARALGYWEIDREVFEMVVPRADVIELTEAQTDIPVEAAIIAQAPISLLAAPVAPVGPPRPAAPAKQPVEQPVKQNKNEPSQNGQRAADRTGHRTLDQMVAWHGSPEPWPVYEQDGHGYPNGNGKRRTARRERVPIQAVFAELADLAAIPKGAYALDDEVPGAMCLLKADGGFEVFASSDDARHEVRFFEDEEAAYFYLFGVLAAESVRNGLLLPAEPTYPDGLGNISKYLRQRNSHNYPPNPVRVLNSRRG